MAGVKEAQAGLLGFNPVALAAGLALGGLVLAGKSAIEVSQEHFIAENNLTNAVKNRGRSVRDAEEQLAHFMQTNRDFISNQNDVINAYANLVREGVKSKDITKLLTLAMNIQATEGGTLQDAVFKLQQAEVGRNRGLATQVGLVLKSIPAHATLAQKQAIVAYNLRQITKAYGDQKPKLDPLVIATNHLKTDWEKLAEDAGPHLIGALSSLAGEIDKDLPSWLHWLQVLQQIAAQLGAIGDGGFGAGFSGDPTRPLRGPGSGSGTVKSGSTVLHIHAPVSVITHAQHAKDIKAAIRASDRSQS